MNKEEKNYTMWKEYKILWVIFFIGCFMVGVGISLENCHKTNTVSVKDTTIEPIRIIFYIEEGSDLNIDPILFENYPEWFKELHYEKRGQIKY